MFDKQDKYSEECYIVALASVQVGMGWKHQVTLAMETTVLQIGCIFTVDNGWVYTQTLT